MKFREEPNKECHFAQSSHEINPTENIDFGLSLAK
jgi:hypothetical protein